MGNEGDSRESALACAERILLREFAPFSVVVDRALNPRHVFGGRAFGAGLSVAGGELNALVLLGEAFTLELRIAITEARREGHRVKRRHVPLRIDDKERRVELDVFPLEHEMFLVVAQELPAEPASLPSGERPPAVALVPESFPDARGATLMVIDREASHRALFEQVAAERNMRLRWHAFPPEDGLSGVSGERCLVFLDCASALTVADRFSSALLGPGGQVVWMSATPSLDLAVQAVQRGALDFLAKPFGYRELGTLVDRAIRFRTLPAADESSPVAAPRGFIGRGPRMVKMYKRLARASLVRSNVLITGETGTGKELVARAIHDHSARRNQPFVTVNCGALVESLLESELFGHERGAFTGATHAQAGLFEAADGGTLFLDEIGDISLAMQVKLLRVLQEGEFRRVGSTRSLPADARVIAATHRDLTAMVAQGTFRQDLYYRLRVLTLDLPPLRERKEDLPELIDFYLARFSAANRRVVPRMAADALALFYEYRWPGNIRELEHALEQAVALNAGDTLGAEDFSQLRNPPPACRPCIEVPGGELRGARDASERERILSVLRSVNGNKSRAAGLLGISRVTLYRKVQRLKIS